MQKSDMGNPTGMESVAMTTITIVLCFISRFTITDWAGIATVIAALSTAGLNVYKFIKEKNKP